MKKVILIVLFFSVLVTVLYFAITNSLKKDISTKKEVVFWSLQMGTFENYMNPIIEEFERNNKDLKIKWIDVPYSEGEKRTLASILSTNPPDLVNLTPDFSSILAQKQALEYIDCSKLTAYNKEILKTLMLDGKCYGIPFYATSSLVFYNKEILDKSQIKQLPKTYSQMNATAKQIKEKSGAYVTMPTLAENDTLLKILNKHGINTPNKLSNKDCFNIFNEYRDLYKSNLIPKESITQNHQEALEKYMSGQLAYIQSGANFLNIIKENAPMIYEKTGVSNQLIGNTNKYDVSVMNLIIPAKAKNQDGALRFALFLTNKKNQIELAKLTTILPVNEAALNDEYFNSSGKDTISKARYLSAKQLNNLQPAIEIKNNRKEIINLINIAMQQIILDKNDIKNELEKTAKNWIKLEER